MFGVFVTIKNKKVIVQVESKDGTFYVWCFYHNFKKKLLHR